MVIDMNDARLDTIEQIREFLAGTADVGFSLPTDKTVRYGFVSTVLKRHRYFERTKGQRGVLFAYLLRLSGYTRQHLTKLIARFRQERSLAPRSRASRTNFGYRYGADDVMLLAEVDRLHDTLSGPATKVILMRAWQVFGDDRFINLSGISVSQPSFVDFTILCCTIYLKPSSQKTNPNKDGQFQIKTTENARGY